MAQKSMMEELFQEEQAAAAEELKNNPPATPPATPPETPPSTPPATPPATPAEVTQPIDLNAVIAEKTGNKFKTVDDLLAAAQKPINQEINFANETSKQVFEFLQEGKVDDFISVYTEQKMLKEVGKMPTDDVLKLSIKYENPDLTAAEIDQEFNERYGVEPLEVDEELDDAADVEKAKKNHQKALDKAERAKKKDLKDAKSLLEQKAQDIVLPHITKEEPKPAEVVDTKADEALVEAERQKYIKSIDPAMTELGDFTTTYKDDDVNISTKVSLEDADKVTLKKDLEEFYIMDFFGNRYLKEDGTFDTKTTAKDVYVLKNLDKIINAHVAQAVQQTKSQLIKGIKNSDFREQVNPDRTDDAKKQEQKMVDYFLSRT